MGRIGHSGPSPAAGRRAMCTRAPDTRPALSPAGSARARALAAVPLGPLAMGIAGTLPAINSGMIFRSNKLRVLN